MSLLTSEQRPLQKTTVELQPSGESLKHQSSRTANDDDPALLARKGPKATRWWPMWIHQKRGLIVSTTKTSERDVG